MRLFWAAMIFKFPASGLNSCLFWLENELILTISRKWWPILQICEAKHATLYRKPGSQKCLQNAFRPQTNGDTAQQRLETYIVDLWLHLSTTACISVYFTMTWGCVMVPKFAQNSYNSFTFSIIWPPNASQNKLLSVWFLLWYYRHAQQTLLWA